MPDSFRQTGAGIAFSKRQINDLRTPRGWISGLGMSNGTDADHDINIAVGAARDTGDNVGMVHDGTIASPFVKQIDATWAEGSAAGGMNDNAAVAIDTWYHVHMLMKPSGVIDFGFDTSVTAANLLADAAVIAAGFSTTWYRRIGSVLTDGSSNIIAFYQEDDLFLWDDPSFTIDYTTANAPTTATNETLEHVPTGFNVQALLRLRINRASGADSVSILSPNINATAPAASGAPLATMSTDAGTDYIREHMVLTNTSAQVSIEAGAASTTVEIVSYGWIDTRGRE